MVENIVFDMGNVLVRYDSMKVCRHFMTDEAEMEKVCTSVFISPEWLMLDMGLITEAEALKRMQKRLPDDHAKEMARLCLEHWNEYCMWKVPGMEELVRELKAEGFGIYLCSNASLRMVTWYKNIIPAWECFDGILYSAEVKCMKPQREMYEHFYERFSLKPEECFFIDDLQDNIDGAKATGMDGYCFADGDLEKLKTCLKHFYRK